MSRRLLWLPPPVVTGFTALIMWLSRAWLADNGFVEDRAAWSQWLFWESAWWTLGVAIVGFALMLVSAQTLRRANTTLLPFAPERTCALVTQGIFNYSRNPIYLGDALLLVAWLLWLGAAINVLWLVLFVLYMTKVQIAAEEQALLQKFGAAYQAYCQRVRRWL